MRRALLLCCSFLLLMPLTLRAQGDLITLSGQTRNIDTPHFRIHYTQSGSDAATPEYARAVAEAAELSWTVQVGQMGWAAPPNDDGYGGNTNYDIFIIDAINRESALGVTQLLGVVSDNPNTEVVEQYAATSLLMIDNDFADVDFENGADAISMMRATVAHEFQHAIQYGYDYFDAHDWIYEATAVWMEVQTVGEDQDATGYVESLYEYPELCFGSVADDADTGLHYGEWLFIDHLAMDFGDEAVRQVWEQSREYEGFANIVEVVTPIFTARGFTAPTPMPTLTPAPTSVMPPTATPASGGGNLGVRPPSSGSDSGGSITPGGTGSSGGSGNIGMRPNTSGSRPIVQSLVEARGDSPQLVQVMRDYRLRNLAREYALAALFGATVWLEDTVDGTDWSNPGAGIQEFGANYFNLALEPGSYQAGLNASAPLTLWQIDIADGKALVYDVAAAGGTVTVRDGVESVLMVFNPSFDEDLSECATVEFDVQFTLTADVPTRAPVRIYDAANFESLSRRRN